MSASSLHSLIELIQKGKKIRKAELKYPYLYTIKAFLRHYVLLLSAIFICRVLKSLH